MIAKEAVHQSRLFFQTLRKSLALHGLEDHWAGFGHHLAEDFV